MDIPIEIILYPPWKGRVAEDYNLQEEAAERLADYITGGDTRINGVGLRLFAEKWRQHEKTAMERPNPWGIKITGSVRTEVVFK